MVLGLYNKVPRSLSDHLIADASHLVWRYDCGALVIIVWQGAFLDADRYYHFEPRVATTTSSRRDYFNATPSPPH